MVRQSELGHRKHLESLAHQGGDSFKTEQKVSGRGILLPGNKNLKLRVVLKQTGSQSSRFEIVTCSDTREIIQCQQQQKELCVEGEGGD